MNRDIKNAIAAAFALVLVGSPAVSAAARGLVYIPLGSAGEVVIVDAEQDAVVGKIEGLPAVHGLAGTPDGRFLIAGSYQERAPGAEMPAKPSAVSEEEHAAHHGAAPASPKKDNAAVSTVSVVRIGDRAVIRRIDVPGAVHHVAVSPDGSFAAVTHPNEGTISAIDLAEYKVITTIKTGPLPNYAVFGPEGKRIYVSNAGNDTISEIDTERWIVRRVLETRSSPEHMVLSSDGAAIYVNNVDDGTVSEIPLMLGVAIRTFQVGGALHGIDLSDDGQTLFVAGREQNTLIAIDLESGELFTAPLAPSPYHLTAIDGTDKLYVSSAEEPKIWVIGQSDFKILGEIPIRGEGHQIVQTPAR